MYRNILTNVYTYIEIYRDTEIDVDIQRDRGGYTNYNQSMTINWLKSIKFNWPITIKYNEVQRRTVHWLQLSKYNYLIYYNLSIIIVYI